MSDTSISNIKQLKEQPNENPPKAMEQPSTSTDHSETSKPPKNLSDMPFDVVALIIERSGYKEQLILRKTSKLLRALVDQQKPALKELWVYYDILHIECNYNDQRINYTSPHCNQLGFWKECKYPVIVTEDYEKIAFDDLASTLNNPKLQLEIFNFYSEEFNDVLEFEKMQNILESINHQLSVKSCQVDVTLPSNAMSILPYLKPGVLETIQIITDRSNVVLSVYSEEIKEVALLDQWKQAKELKLTCLFDEMVLTQHATHFKRFQFDEGYIETETLARIRDCLLNHTNFQFCSILGEYENMDEYRNSIGVNVSPNSSHYSIPYSDEYLEFMFKDLQITIEKKKKQNRKRNIDQTIML